MLIKPASAMRFLLSCCVLQRAVLCDIPENKKFKITDWKCSSSKSRFLTLYGASLRDCTLGCDIRKKCNAVNYFRHLRMCELLSDVTFEEQQENVGSCVYINRNDIITNVLSDVCKNNCSDLEVCDRQQRKCTVKECQPLSVEHAEIMGNMMSFGSRCQIRCNPSYTAVGGKTGTTCSQTGKWEPTLLCEQDACQPNWVLFQGWCYWFGVNAACSFSDVPAYCTQLHSAATMLYVESNTENTFIKNEMKQRQATGYWAGITDAETEGTWTWYVTKTITDIFYWGIREPNGNILVDEDCAIYEQKKDWKWADVVCGRSFEPICKMPSNDYTNV